MNNTATYISDLLYRYECVIIPGFGAFLTKRGSATIQPDTHAFFPPQKLLSFNSQLQNNDGLLANYIASVEQISYTDALAKIQRYVLQLNTQIQKGERVVLDGIGAFYSSVENTLQFEPSQEVNYLTEAFGLTSFISPSIERTIEATTETVATEKATREVYKEQVAALEEKAPIAFTPERRNERPYLKYAAIAVIGLGVAGFLGLQRVNQQTDSYNEAIASQADKEVDSRIQQATFEISNPLPAIQLTTVKETVVTETEEEIVTPIATTPKENAKYHIMAGAFRIKANAENKVKELEKEGFTPRLVGVNKYGLHQVVYASYPNRATATVALQNIKENTNPRAWILIKEL